MIQRLQIENEGSGVLMIFIELEASEFHAKPGQTFELRVEVPHLEGNFHLLHDVTGIRAFPPDHATSPISVFCEGIELNPGHQMYAKAAKRHS